MDCLIAIAQKLKVELAYVYIQFLKDQNLMTVVHKLEEDSRCHFDIDYFSSLITNGKLKEAERYISAFTIMDDNRNSKQIFFVLRKQNYLETLYNGDLVTAEGMLDIELKPFEASHEAEFAHFKEILKSNNVRNHNLLSGFEDIKSVRKNISQELERRIRSNPEVRPKLKFPEMEASRLLKIIQHSFSWQHMQCRNPKPNPEVNSLFVDHSCDQGDETEAPFTLTNASHESALPCTPPPTAILEQQGTPQVSSRCASGKQKQKQKQKSVQITQPDQTPRENVDDLPVIVVETVRSGSTVTSMDFHPVRQELLLIGTETGYVAVWDLISSKLVVHSTFKGKASEDLQKALAVEVSQAVNRVKWNSEGTNIGVAYSGGLMRVYSFLGSDIINYFEYEVHTSSVNDVAFTKQGNELWAITCGDDTHVKVWDTFLCELKFLFEGHDAPVCSVCPGKFNDHEAIFSADVDGNIKVWYYNPYDNVSKANLAAPQQIAARIALSADGTRMFLGGTSMDNISCIVEMRQNGERIKREYNGLAMPSVGLVQYDITSRFLVAVDEHLVKFWDVDHDNLLRTTTSGGELPASACIKMNIDATLLAVATNSNTIKILANSAGKRIFRAAGKRVMDASREAACHEEEAPSTSGVKAVIDKSTLRIMPNISNNSSKGASPTPRIRNSTGASTQRVSSTPKSSMLDKNQKKTNKRQGRLTRTKSVKEVTEASQCRIMRLSNKFPRKSVCWLAYTRKGSAILALSSTGEHRMWEWEKTSQNASGMASASYAPKLWKAPGDIKMINEVGYTNPDGYVPTFTLPRASSGFVISSSGAKVSVYNTKTFEKIVDFMPPPPAATSLAIHPNDNNTIVLGMDDSSIQIYQCREKKVLAKLKGHAKRVTGLTISHKLNLLVSSGADSQLCIWRISKWKKVGSTSLQVPQGLTSDTRVAFHQDQIRFLVVHKAHIGVYGAPDLCCLNHWSPPNICTPITHAVYSCDCEFIYMGFGDGSVGVLNASSFKLTCKINPSAYVPQTVKSKPYPQVLAAHPSEPNQFALGLTDGLVVVLEPLEEEGTWGDSPAEYGAGQSSAMVGNIALEELSWEYDV